MTTNPYYTPSGAPATSSTGSSSIMRIEFALIQAAFGLLPALTSGTAVIVNSGGTALTNTTGRLALAGDFATTGAFNTTFAQSGSTTVTLPSTSSTMARTDAAQTFTGIQTFSTPIATASVATMTATVGGGVPTPPNNATTFLRGDGTFATVTTIGVTTGTSLALSALGAMPLIVTRTGSTAQGLVTPLNLATDANTVNDGVSIQFNMQNSTPVTYLYGQFGVIATNVTAGAETSKYTWKLSSAGVFSEVMSLSGAGVIGGTLSFSGGITHSNTTTFNGKLTLSQVGNAIFMQMTASTGTDYIDNRITNGSGETIIALEGSSAGNRATGSAAYASIFGSTTATATQLATNNSVRLSISASGAIQFVTGYGTGSITSDASGNLTSVSDAEMKDVEGVFTRGLADVCRINTTRWRWNKESGFDGSTLMSSFTAQDVEAGVPEAVFVGKDGKRTIYDRTLIAANINAIKELCFITNDHEARIRRLER